MMGNAICLLSGRNLGGGKEQGVILMIRERLIRVIAITTLAAVAVIGLAAQQAAPAGDATCVP
jgi:hypothetical protein